MSLLDRLRPAPLSSTSRTTSDVEAVGPVAAALTGIWTAALTWVVFALPVLLAWATAAQSTATWSQALRVGTAVWLAMHRVAIDVPFGTVALAPLAGTAVPVWLCWLAGRRIGANCTASAAGHQARHLARSLAPAIVSLAGGYAVVLVLGAALARGDGTRPSVWQAVVAGLVLPLMAAGAGALRGSGAPVASTLADLLALPPVVRRAARPAAMGAALLVACGAAAVTASLVLHLDRVLTLHRALDAGAVGGLVITLAQVALTPNLALWGTAFVAGPGFAVGAGTLVSPAASDLGLLPLVPVLGALPSPGALPAPLMAVVLVPVGVGALIGWWVAARLRGAGDGPLDVVCDALAAAAGAAALLVVALALSGGSAGPGALATVGPSPWRVGLVLAGQLAAGAASAAWITHRWRRP